jgi:hypothetical protein
MENEQVVDNQGDGQQTTTPDALDNIIIDGGEQHETDTVVEGEENGEESAKTGDEPAKDDSQKSVQKAIDKQYRLRREAEEKAAELAARVEALERRLQPSAPVKLDPPDPFDPDYDSKIKAYEKSIMDRARYDYDQEINRSNAQRQQQEQANAYNRGIQENLNQYNDIVKKNNIDPERLETQTRIVTTYLKSPEIANYLLSHKSGPMIVGELASDMDRLEKLSGMTPLQAAAAIERDVASKLYSKQKPKFASTGDLHSSGSSRSSEPEILRGMKFE